jgi:hypothetical protein
MQVAHDANLLEAAGRLARLAGTAGPRALTALAGGMNNRVFRVEIDGGAPLVLKGYFHDPRDPRDRLATEWNFLTFAWARGVRAIPEPLAHEPASHIALYGFVSGTKIAAGAVTDAHVAAAADFVLAINAPPRTPTMLPPGSEACFSLAQHVATVSRRVDRLSDLAPDAPLRTQAECFVADRLRPVWRGIEARIDREARTNRFSFDQELDPADCCLSPSDFGFHNALEDEDGRITFLDFEYAGRDDPAKLVCDYFCQPEVPVPMCHFESFQERAAAGLGLDSAVQDRCRLLLDAYRVKWTCIMLNDFLAVGAARRAFAEAGAWERRCRAQLAKAEAKLLEIRDP